MARIRRGARRLDWRGGRFRSVAARAGDSESNRVKTGDDLDIWEHRLEERVATDTTIQDTDREAIIKARLLLKQRVMEIEHRCRIRQSINRSHVRTRIIPEL
jgi:hypothetical protein